MTPELWLAEIEEPLYRIPGRVSAKVAEQEFAMFKSAQNVLQPGG